MAPCTEDGKMVCSCMRTRITHLGLRDFTEYLPDINARSRDGDRLLQLLCTLHLVLQNLKLPSYLRHSCAGWQGGESTAVGSKSDFWI